MGDTEQYRLIIYSNPSDSKSHENRRFVRSHVTKRQHRSMKNQANARNRRRNNDSSNSLRQAVAPASRVIDQPLTVFIPSSQTSNRPNGIGLLSPNSFQECRSFDDSNSSVTASFHASRRGSVASTSIQEPPFVFDGQSPVSYHTPPPDFQEDQSRMPRSHLPFIGTNDDAQTAYDASSLLLKAISGISDEYELTLEALACAKISAALQNSRPSDILIRAIAHMAHYDQISPKRRHASLFHHHMECLAECVQRIGGIGLLCNELQHYIFQIDHVVAAFQGTNPYFSPPSHLPSPI